jgi:hypothetical protein
LPAPLCDSTIAESGSGSFARDGDQIQQARVGRLADEAERIDVAGDLVEEITTFEERDRLGALRVRHRRWRARGIDRGLLSIDGPLFGLDQER